MATKTLVQNSSKSIATKILTNSAQKDQLSTISLMLEYDIDQTLNTIKESNNLLKSSSYLIAGLKQDLDLNSDNNKNKNEINNNLKAHLYPTTENSLSTSSSSSSTSSAFSSTQPSTARKRWNILAKVLRKDSEESTISSEDDEASVRRFKSFEILKQDSFEDPESLNVLGKPENWYTYKLRIDQDFYCVNIHHIDRHLTASDLMGFNNTGNICVWPSEEALTVYVMSELTSYRGKWILELGGGMTCLTGLMLAKYAKPFVVNLTDGNAISVENVRKTICLNELSCYTKCSILQWENVESRNYTEFEKFDVILSADCLFFDDARLALVDTIWFYLAPKGIALIMAPRRNLTMSNFIEECRRKGFELLVVQKYNNTIWQRHLELKTSELYDEDIHYPILIKLTKPII